MIEESASWLVVGSFFPKFWGDEWWNLTSINSINHQTFQVPKMEVLTYISCMDTAYVREHSSPKWPKIRFFRTSILGTWNSWWINPINPSDQNSLDEKISAQPGCRRNCKNCMSRVSGVTVFGMRGFQSYGGEPQKWWVFPNKTHGVFLLKNDQHLGCEMGGNPPFKETPIFFGKFRTPKTCFGKIR